MHSPYPTSSLAGLGQPLSPASAWPAQPPKNTHKSYIIIPGKTPLTQDCSFFSQLLGQGHAPVNSQFSQQRLLHFRVCQNVFIRILSAQNMWQAYGCAKKIVFIFVRICFDFLGIFLYLICFAFKIRIIVKCLSHPNPTQKQGPTAQNWKKGIPRESRQCKQTLQLEKPFAAKKNCPLLTLHIFYCA